MIYTTLSRIRVHSPCNTGWHKLLVALKKTKADDEPLAYSTILDANGLEDAIWCMLAEPQHEALWRMYAVRCARRVQHLMTDPRSVAALDVAERHAYGQATDEELAAARAAAWGNDGEASLWGNDAWAIAWAVSGDAAWAAWGAARAASRAKQTADFLAMLAAYEAAPGCVGRAVL